MKIISYASPRDKNSQKSIDGLNTDYTQITSKNGFPMGFEELTQNVYKSRLVIPEHIPQLFEKKGINQIIALVDTEPLYSKISCPNLKKYGLNLSIVPIGDINNFPKESVRGLIEKIDKFSTAEFNTLIHGDNGDELQNLISEAYMKKYINKSRLSRILNIQRTRGINSAHSI